MVGGVWWSVAKRGGSTSIAGFAGLERSRPWVLHEIRYPGSVGKAHLIRDYWCIRAYNMNRMAEPGETAGTPSSRLVRKRRALSVTLCTARWATPLAQPRIPPTGERHRRGLESASMDRDVSRCLADGAPPYRPLSTCERDVFRASDFLTLGCRSIGRVRSWALGPCSTPRLKGHDINAYLSTSSASGQTCRHYPTRSGGGFREPA